MTKISKRIVLQAALGLALFSTAAMPAFTQTSNNALALTWKGYADTDLNFTEFALGDHTIAWRFMAQFPNAYEGPMVAENGNGTFIVGQGDFNYGTAGPKIYAAIGSHAAVQYNVNLLAGQWHHLAVAVTNSTGQKLYALYLDGSLLGSFSVSASDPNLPRGTLRFGKRTTGQTVGGRDGQYYGFLDDVAVFNRALSTAEVQNLAASGTVLSGFESGLIAGYTFETGSLPYKLSRPVSLSVAATRTGVSSNRNSASDSALLPLPTQQSELTLPFVAGEAWQVIQGFDSNASGSHRGYASFCWDFMVAGQPQPNNYPNGTRNAPYRAAAPGTVNYLLLSNTEGGSTPNVIGIQQGQGEYASYLHSFPNGSAVTMNQAVTRGQLVGYAGDVGAAVGANHLHFAISDKTDSTPGFVTYPVAFSNYEVRDASGNWHRVLRGIPQNGQVIRNPPVPAARYNAVFRPGTTPQMQMLGASVEDLVTAYNAIWPNGWRLSSLESVVEGGLIRYNAVWKPGTNGEVQVYGWNYTDFKKKFDDLWNQGWRLSILQSFVYNGQVLYNAVWTPSTANEIAVFGWTYNDFRNYYNSIWAQGYRLNLVQTYVMNGQVLYNATWRPTGNGEIQTFGVSYQSYRSQYDSLWSGGWRLKMLQAYSLNGQTYYNAVWTPTSSGEVQVYNASYAEYRQNLDSLIAQGWQLAILDVFEP